MRTILPFVFLGSVVCLSAGCSHMFESRVVQAFAESVKAHDVARLKTETSADFEEKAVKGDDTFRALSMLELPEGMPKVVSVKPIKDEDGKKVVAKRVVATIGKEKRKVFFRLAPDEKTGRWVVDDLFLSREAYFELHLLSLRIHPIELGAELPRCVVIRGGEEIDRRLRRSEPSRGVDARSDPETDVYRT